ncbi:MAG: CgeB family protein [Thermoplasmatota archaeon]
MRLLVVGEFWAAQYEESLARAFEDLGCEVGRFSTYRFLAGSGMMSRLERRMHEGPLSWRMRRLLQRAATAFRPDVIFFRRPLEFSSKFLRTLKQDTGAIMVAYQNDDPYGPHANPVLWRRFRESVPEYDLILAFRELNRPEFLKAGAKRVEVLLPYYVEELHQPPAWRPGEKQAWSTDAVFVGHGEDDARVDVFDALMRADLTLRLHGSGFEAHARGRPHERLLPTQYLPLESYPRAIAGAGAALAFYSALNRDVMTTRIFEIPACGGLLVALRNETVARLLRPDREALFFSTPDEAVALVSQAKDHPDWAMELAAAGRRRIRQDKHEVHDRALQVLAAVHNLGGRAAV